MEEDVKPKDEDGVDGRGLCGWDGCVCGLGTVGVSSIFGLVRRTRAFTGGILTFTLVSGLHLEEHNCDTCHFFSTTFSSQLEEMVGGALEGVSVLRVVLGVGRAFITSGSHTGPSYSCDGCVCFSFRISARDTQLCQMPLLQVGPPSRLDHVLWLRLVGPSLVLCPSETD